ncbi:protein containing Sporulation/cell division region [Sulfurimonas gotlandica GD1]|uniref:Protein containing Sporulation/cell division region n=1 Tax=Sulfurimonas gotlandica (strain DSM 19862 / JCM 16533 / GD1) TaxID=929558 RepID=H1FZ26_SULGG|nr:SPOR domain-containing protein [Sulfurimonas gotlandica]EHP30910.1 protein containing Sporulation/cell division region [Sulfurimonas gotlandica GD1]
MNEKNELNDIILNRGGSTGGNKKIVLAVATLGVILIIVVMLMSTLTPDAKDNLPQPIPLPQEEVASIPEPKDEPLFEEVKVIEENSKNNDNLDEIAQRLKQESQDSKTATKPKEVNKIVKTTPKAETKKVAEVKKETPKAEEANAQAYFVQVGSFSKYAPNKKFLDSILSQGYRYKFHKVTNDSKILNKVLVGPFYNEKEARAALRTIRSNIEAGAFLIKQ